MAFTVVGTVTVPVNVGLARGAFAARSLVRFVTADSGIPVNEAPEPLGARTSVPMTNPRFVRAPEAVEAPVPPSATATSVEPGA